MEGRQYGGKEHALIMCCKNQGTVVLHENVCCCEQKSMKIASHEKIVSM